VFPSPADFNKLFAVKPLPTEINRLVTRLWQQYKTD
jgi:putrescine transport system substrate-binding protein